MERSHLELVGKGVGAGPEMGRKGGSFKTGVRMETVRRGAWGGSGREQRARRGVAQRKAEK